ncbi:MAG TPA: MFS transporter [Candidatus Thermoplasmatota archaeon]|nr:MFS transporter [Candidatus Thermoplasmatota archaeon]
MRQAVSTDPEASAPPGLRLGLRANWRQFALLMAVNGFVGAMVGQERAILPLLATETFGIPEEAAILSFLVAFGLTKAGANLVAGRLSDRCGRKPILVVGWLIGLPVPLLLIAAPSWDWIVFANALLGINQGLCWSATVIMKIDLAGPARRGLAMGLNEEVGYLAVSLASIATGFLASAYALRPVPFYPGLAFAAIGLALSLLFVRETHDHARLESRLALPGSGHAPPGTRRAPAPSFRWVFARASWRDRNLAACAQAGLVNNLNDGVSWGVLPLFFAAGGLGPDAIGILAGAYTFVWGGSQIRVGAWTDTHGRKPFLVGGMILQAAALLLFASTQGFWPWLAASVLIGFGTTMVYPTLLAAVSDASHPSWRASAVGVYRLWRDLGYAAGAVFAGFVAAAAGLQTAIAATGVVTLASGLVALALFRETVIEPAPRVRIPWSQGWALAMEAITALRSERKERKRPGG